MNIKISLVSRAAISVIVRRCYVTSARQKILERLRSLIAISDILAIGTQIGAQGIQLSSWYL